MAYRPKKPSKTMIADAEKAIRRTRKLLDDPYLSPEAREATLRMLAGLERLTEAAVQKLAANKQEEPTE